MAGRSVTRAELVARPSVELYFMRLPDGYPQGTGTPRSGYTSLQQLYTGTVASLTTIDGSQQQTYTRAELVTTLGALMTSASPTAIRSQDNLSDFGDGDHSDHHAVGRLAFEARGQALPSVPFQGYMGYHSMDLPVNVTGADLVGKQNALFAYAPHDAGMCSTVEECSYGAEGAWLQRSYLADGTGAVDAPPPATGTNVAPLATATASTQNTSTGQTAAKAIDGVVDGYPGNYAAEWATTGEGTGAWLQLTWAAPVELDRLVLHDRPNEYDQVTGATLTFSDGSTVAVPSLSDTAAGVTVSFTARSTTSVRVTVTSVSGSTSNVGLAEVEAFTDGSVPDPDPVPGPELASNVAAAAAVTASTQNTSTGQTATKAVDGVVDGYPGDHTAEWATQGEGAGAWLQLTWASPVTLGRVVLHDRPNEYDQVTGARLTFSDGTTVDVAPLDNTGASAVVDFPARATTSLRVTLTSVSTFTSNAGLSEVEAWTTTSSPAPDPLPLPDPLPVPDPGPGPQPDPLPVLGGNVAPTATATASSQNSETTQTAAKAIDGIADGYPGDYTAEWATQGEGVGAWLQLDWATPVDLARVVLRDRPNEWEQVLGGTLTFSDGSTVAVPALDNAGAAVAVDFPARTVSWVRFTVTTVGQYSSNIGLSELEAWTPGTAAPAVAAAPVPSEPTPSEPVTEPSGTPPVEEPVPADPATADASTGTGTAGLEPQDVTGEQPAADPAG
jgi:hypothetical protein